MAAVQKVIKGIQLVGRDAQRVVRGAAAFLRYLRTQEDLDVGLGMFAAASNIAVIGEPNWYEVRIANALHTSREVTLGIDIYDADRPRHPEGHYCLFTKNLIVQAATACTITIQYDWRTEPSLLIEGAGFPPDTLWSGGISRYQLYSVTAALSSPYGTRLDELTIYQGLTV